MKWLAALVSCVLLSAPALAREITPAERRDHSFSAALPSCGDPSVLGQISSDFSTRESRFWQSSLTILGFEQVVEAEWRPWGLDYIPRRYCTGTVIVSDGYRRRINYSVRENLGFLGISWGADWCVVGLDRNYAYAPLCKQAQP